MLSTTNLKLLILSVGGSSTAFAVIVMVSFLIGHVTSSSSFATSSYKLLDGSEILSFPLLSHHHIIERRRRELLLLSSSSNNVQEEDSNNIRHLATKQHAQQQLGALYQGYGTHYIDIWVGHPAQRQTAIVDTGSGVTAFPCSECTDCGHHTDTPFNEKASESFQPTHCEISSTDTDGGGCILGKCEENGLCMMEHNFGTPGSSDASSWTAYEAQDVAYAGGPHDRSIDSAKPMIDPDVDELNPVHAPEFSFPLSFGCQTSVTGYFERQLASGVMGLDRRAQSFWGQMRASQTIQRAQFSLCFVKQPIASTSGSTAGAVTLGGVDTRLHSTPMVFAKSVGEGSTASFKVQMRKIYLREGNDKSVMFDAKQKYHLIDVSDEELNSEEMYSIDSGTTDTYFIKSLSDEFRNLWLEVTGFEYTNDPIAVSKDSDLLKFPTIVLQMIPHTGGVGDEVQTDDPRTVPGLAGNVDMSTPNDVLIAIPPKHYMQRNAKDNTYTSRIYLDREDALGNVLGANSMMGHDILFDLDNNRIGFSESECDYARLVAQSGKASMGDGLPTDGGGSGEFSLAASEDDYKICSSEKCRGFFGLTVAVLSVCFLFFARRYINKRDDRDNVQQEYEMKLSSSRNLNSSNRSFDGSYRDDGGGYRDSHRPRSGSRDSDRGSSRSGERRSSMGEPPRRSSSRDYMDDSANRSIQSVHSHRSGHSTRSNRSRESNRSHHSSRSHDSHRSNRSRESTRSNRSTGSRDSRRRNHDDEYDDEMPPSIS